MRRAPVLRRTGPGDAADARGYSQAGLRGKLAAQARRAGREVVERVLWLHYAAQRPDVPRWAKLTIYGALAYFILPLDAIPDLLPGVGYVDDLGALSAALLTVAAYVDDNVKRRARSRLEKWFGEPPAGGQ